MNPKDKFAEQDSLEQQKKKADNKKRGEAIQDKKMDGPDRPST